MGKPTGFMEYLREERCFALNVLADAKFIHGTIERGEEFFHAGH